jgi:hypothetical protein
MKKYKIKHIHANVGTFNGTLYFVVNNKLMLISVSTPNFNDYGEWRISEITISKDDYKPEENDVSSLLPYDIKTIEITEKELEYISLFFSYFEGETTDDTDVRIANMAEYLKENKNSEYPCLYQSSFCSGFFDGEDELQHSIEEYVNEKMVNDYYIKTSEWKRKNSIVDKNGIYNILIPIMSDYVHSNLKK